MGREIGEKAEISAPERKNNVGGDEMGGGVTPSPMGSTVNQTTLSSNHKLILHLFKIY